MGRHFRRERHAIETGRRFRETKRRPIDSKRRFHECESGTIEPSDAFLRPVRHSQNQVTLSRFIGRRYRFQAPRLPRKRARSNPKRPVFRQKTRRSIPEGTFTIPMQQVETKTHGHEIGKAQSYLPSSARFSSRTLTRGSPRKPSWRSCVCSVTSAFTRVSSSPRARATRFTW
jgi:hypothetical protein